MGTADAGKPQTTGNSRGRSRCPSKEALGAAAPAMAAEVEASVAGVAFRTCIVPPHDGTSGRGTSRRPSRFLDALLTHCDPTTDPLPQGSFRAPAQGTVIRPRIPSADLDLASNGGDTCMADGRTSPTDTSGRIRRSRHPSEEAMPMVAARVMTEAEEATGAAEATFGSLATPAARDDGSGRGASRRPSRFLDALPAHYDPTTDPLPEGSFRAPAQGTIVRPRIPSAEPELVIDGSGMGTADA
eukprot:6724219-Prymnesium_polylepis.1